MKIPYGRSDFSEIRRRGMFYVDKTPFLPTLESDEAGYVHLLFLRPRRFGTSTLLSMLENERAPPARRGARGCAPRG